MAYSEIQIEIYCCCSGWGWGSIRVSIVKGIHRPDYFVCLWTSQEVHRAVPHPGQLPIDSVIPLASQTHCIYLLAMRTSIDDFGLTQTHTHTTTFFFGLGFAIRTEYPPGTAIAWVHRISPSWYLSNDWRAQETCWKILNPLSSKLWRKSWTHDIV